MASEQSPSRKRLIFLKLFGDFSIYNLNKFRFLINKISLGIITSIINAYYHTRLLHIEGYFSINQNVKLDKNKFYAVVKVENDTIKVRNILHENIEETNVYYDESCCEDFEVSDDNEVLTKWIEKNKEYDFYIVEYKTDSISLKNSYKNTYVEIARLQGKLEILEKLKEKSNRSFCKKVVNIISSYLNFSQQKV